MRSRLTEATVLDLYRCKGGGESASKLSRRYGIHEKTVRDIWKGRTWAKETGHPNSSQSVDLKGGEPKIKCENKMLQKKRKHICIADGGGIPNKASKYDTLSTSDSNSDNFQRLSRLLSIDAQIHDWNEKGYWILSPGPEFQAFLDDFCSEV